MKQRTKLAICVCLLILVGVGMTAYKVVGLGVPFWKGEKVHDWQIEAKVTFYAPAKRDIRVRLSLPDGRNVSWIGGSASLDYKSDIYSDAGKETAVWTRRKLESEGPQALYYWVRLREEQSSGMKPIAAGAIAPQAHEISGMAGAAASSLIRKAYSLSAGPDSLFVALVSEVTKTESSQEVQLIKRRYEKDYRDEAEVMLVLDLLRQSGVPARLCHALRLTTDGGVQEPYLMVEYHDGVYWKIRDIHKPAASLDRAHWFVWNRGGRALLDEVSGGENSKVSFTVTRERVSYASLSSLGNSPLLVSTIMGLPQSERGVFRYLVLIPLGAFVVVLLRNLIGVPTLGTFMPVLIALALLEIEPVWSGLLMFAVLVAVGLSFRFLLSRLNLLVVPRVAACVVIVALLMILMTVVSYGLGYGGLINITLFPMIILAWTIERMSIIWEEEGRRNALVQVGGSLLVAFFAFFCMSIGQIQYWVFHFPELLLVLLAGILMIGRYTGYRVSELIRFRNFECS